ncbi:hypothetical protein HJFPF1_00578 [Paramyrothecium foliicola]|nr:hypothetical protein HJFPF1_00578 [Paramyrothecium foliicola]
MVMEHLGDVYKASLHGPIPSLTIYKMSTRLQEVSHLNTRIESSSLPIFLRTVRLQDAPSHAQLLSAPANATDPAARRIDPATSEKYITQQLESLKKPTVTSSDGGRVVSGPGRVNMVVCLKSDAAAAAHQGIVIGLGGFGAIKDLERDGRPVRAGDVGVMLDPAHRGRGYGIEAMRLAIDWAFTPAHLGGPQLDLVTITTLEENVAMVKLTEEKLNLSGKGVLRPAGHDTSKQERYYEVTPELWKHVNADLGLVSP